MIGMGLKPAKKISKQHEIRLLAVDVVTNKLIGITFPLKSVQTFKNVISVLVIIHGKTKLQHS